MDAEWKRKWLEALRSGKYNQGKDCLRDGDKYCCLGVLASMVCDEVDEFEYSQGGDPDDIDDYHHYFDGEGACLSIGIAERVGLIDSGAGIVGSVNPEMDYKGRVLRIAWLNDNAGLPFTELADLIEEQL